MENFKFQDRATLSGVRRLSDGYLATEAFAVRTGIQIYTGEEMGRPDLESVRVYRPESEVRAADSLRTFSHAPVTIGHPSVMVTADNWRDYAVGEVSTEAEWKDGKIRLPLILKDKGAIAAVEGGVRELSAGYLCQLDWQKGQTEAGEEYDCVQRNIRINHLAIVPKGRAGSECRVGDTAGWGSSPTSEERKNEMTLKVVVLGDQAVNVAADDVAKVEGFRDASRVAATATEIKIAEKDRELATKDARIKELETEVQGLKDSALSTEALDARVEARNAIVAKVRSLDANIDPKGKTDAELKKLGVEKHYGKDTAAGKSAEYIDTAFELIRVESNSSRTGDPAVLDRAYGGGQPPADFGHSAYTKNLANAWQGQAAGKE